MMSPLPQSWSKQSPACWTAILNPLWRLSALCFFSLFWLQKNSGREYFMLTSTVGIWGKLGLNYLCLSCQLCLVYQHLGDIWDILFQRHALNLNLGIIWNWSVLPYKCLFQRAWQVLYQISTCTFPITHQWVGEFYLNPRIAKSWVVCEHTSQSPKPQYLAICDVLGLGRKNMQMFTDAKNKMRNTPSRLK